MISELQCLSVVCRDRLSPFGVSITVDGSRLGLLLILLRRVFLFKLGWLVLGGDQKSLLLIGFAFWYGFVLGVSPGGGKFWLC